MDAIDRLGTSMLQKPQIFTVEDMTGLCRFDHQRASTERITSEGDRIVPTQQFADNMDSGFMKALAPLQKGAKFQPPPVGIAGRFCHCGYPHLGRVCAVHFIYSLISKVILMILSLPNLSLGCDSLRQAQYPMLI